MPFTTTYQNDILDEFFSVERFMSLHSADPGGAGSYAAEVTTVGTAYERQSLDGLLGSASGGIIVNTDTIIFPVITASYPIVTHFAAGSALTGGTMGIIGVFNQASLRSIGQRYQFAPGTIRFRLI